MQTRNWHIQPQVDLPSSMLEFVNHDRIAANYLLRQGITSPNQIKTYLDPDRNNLADPFELPDMQAAVTRIIQALDREEVIGIWGDFDVDGQTSTAILVECLSRLGATVEFYLPVRGKESHGIAISTLRPFLDRGIQLLITCDTGISEHAAVQFANAQQVDVVISDHHTLPDVLPSAVACVNPRRLSGNHALATLSGSGAAFEIMLAVCRAKNREEIAFQCIDLAALGLIADLASLQKDARLIAQLGLQRMNQKLRICIQAMLAAANIKSNGLDEQTVGYVIAPRLNAFGRLDDANPLVSFLMDADPSAIPGIAQKLEQINSNRRFLSSQVGQSAVELYNRHPELWEDPVIILSNPDWPGGVLGLAANRLVTEFNRPAILFNESADGYLRGSARSVEGINITEAISSARQFLDGFGGHPMAAGMSLSVNNLPEFRRSINNWIKVNGLSALPPPLLEIDAEIKISEITPDMYATLQKLAPFGVGNPPLMLSTHSVKITSTKSLGRSKEHFKFVLEDQDGHNLPAIWWNADTSHIPTGWFDLAYSIRENYFQGESTLQAEWVDFRLLEDSSENLTLSKDFQLIDLRNSDDPLGEAKKLIGHNSFLVFQEPPPVGDKVTVGRSQLAPGETLVLASIPPDISELEKIIQIAQPQKIFLAFEAPAPISPIIFLKRLSALIQFTIQNKDGVTHLENLADATNSTEDTIESGLRWLAADGKIQIRSVDHKIKQFSISGLSKDLNGKLEAENAIEFKLKETLAFQKYFYSLPIDDLKNLLSGFFQSNKKTGRK